MKAVLTNEFMDKIREALPEIQVSTIRSKFDELDRLQELTERQEEGLKALRRELSDSEKELSSTEKQLRESQAIAAKLQDEVTKLNQLVTGNEIAALRAELKGVGETTDKFLKNTIYRETLQHQVVDETPMIQTQYSPNGGSTPIQTGVSKNNRTVTDVKTNEHE